jgi:hypothetical protein
MKPIAIVGCVFVAILASACADPEPETRDTVPAEIVEGPPASEPSAAPSGATTGTTTQAPAPSTTPTTQPAPTQPKVRQCFSIMGDMLVSIDASTGTAKDVRAIPATVNKRVSVARRDGEFFACGLQGLVRIDAKAGLEVISAVKCDAVAADETGFWVLPTNSKVGPTHYPTVAALRTGGQGRSLPRLNATELSAGDGSLLVRTQAGVVSRVDRITGAAMPFPDKIDLTTAEGFHAVDGEILAVERNKPAQMFAYDPANGALKRQINLLQLKTALTGLACE